MLWSAAALAVVTAMGAQASPAGAVETGFQRVSFLAAPAPPMAFATFPFSLASPAPLRVRPYLGAGRLYTPTFVAPDRPSLRLGARIRAGFTGRAGVEALIGERASAFLDVKKAFLRTDAEGALTPVPAARRLRVDPLAVSAGLAFRF